MPQDSPLPSWLTLPPTPNLPSNNTVRVVNINGVDLWYADYVPPTGGMKDDAPNPVVLIHGALAHSGYFGAIIEPLMHTGRRVITVDLRGHGRSNMDSQPLSFELFAADVHALLDSLNVTKASWLGWSCGAVTIIAALMDTTLSSTIDRAFIFAGYHTYLGIVPAFANSAVFTEYLRRSREEYVMLRPMSDYDSLVCAVDELESTQPAWNAGHLAKITLGHQVTIAGAQYDEAVYIDQAEKLHEMIKGSRLVTLRNVSHFALLQDPEQFVTAFLASETV